MRDDKGLYNETAFLLSVQNDYVIKVIKFDGTTKAYMHNKKDFTNQCILKSLEELITYVNICNTRNVDLKKGKRIETPLFNEDDLLDTKEQIIRLIKAYMKWKK